MNEKTRIFDHIIFDFDGTIADSGEIAFRAINSMAGKFGFRNIDWDDVDRMRTMSVNDRCRYMGVSILKLPFFASEYYSYYKSHMNDLRMFPGMRELIEKLHENGMQVSVISSNDEGNIREFFESEDLSVFDNILCSSHLFHKDKIINRFLRQNGIDRERVIYVGDELRDIEACKRASVKVIWVDWGLDLKETVIPAGPDFMAGSPDDIYDIVFRDGK